MPGSSQKGTGYRQRQRRGSKGNDSMACSPRTGWMRSWRWSWQIGSDRPRQNTNRATETNPADTPPSTNHLPPKPSHSPYASQPPGEGTTDPNLRRASSNERPSQTPTASPHYNPSENRYYDAMPSDSDDDASFDHHLLVDTNPVAPSSSTNSKPTGLSYSYFTKIHSRSVACQPTIAHSNPVARRATVAPSNLPPRTIQSSA